MKFNFRGKALARRSRAVARAVREFRAAPESGYIRVSNKVQHTFSPPPSPSLFVPSRRAKLSADASDEGIVTRIDRGRRELLQFASH